MNFEEAHALACARGAGTYIDPRTGYQVMTALALRARGHCCGVGCRHCPYSYENVPPAHRAALLRARQQRS